MINNDYNDNNGNNANNASQRCPYVIDNDYNDRPIVNSFDFCSPPAHH